MLVTVPKTVKIAFYDIGTNNVKEPSYLWLTYLRHAARQSQKLFRLHSLSSLWSNKIITNKRVYTRGKKCKYLPCWLFGEGVVSRDEDDEDEDSTTRRTRFRRGCSSSIASIISFSFFAKDSNSSERDRDRLRFALFGIVHK